MSRTVLTPTQGRVAQAYMKEMPQAALFLGPPSVGKGTIARYIADFLSISVADSYHIPKLTTEAARHLASFAQHQPQGRQKLSIVKLQGARETAINTLLKAVEEASSTTRFIFTARTAPLETLQSRCSVFHVPLLPDSDVARALEQRGFKPDSARRLASVANGSVVGALAAAKGFEEKMVVLNALRAFIEKDQGILESVASRWTDKHTALLQRWCEEAITQKWGTFQPAEIEGYATSLPVRIMTALDPDVRPRLLVRANLMTLLRSMT